MSPDKNSGEFPEMDFLPLDFSSGPGTGGGESSGRKSKRKKAAAKTAVPEDKTQDKTADSPFTAAAAEPPPAKKTEDSDMDTKDSEKYSPPKVTDFFKDEDDDGGVFPSPGAGAASPAESPAPAPSAPPVVSGGAPEPVSAPVPAAPAPEPAAAPAASEAASAETPLTLSAAPEPSPSAPEPAAASAASAPPPEKAPPAPAESPKPRSLVVSPVKKTDRLVGSLTSKNASPGQILQETRATMGLSPAQVEHATKIRVSYLEALERDDYKNLPPLVYIQAYVRNLCSLYHLSEDDAKNISENIKKNLKKFAAKQEKLERSAPPPTPPEPAASGAPSGGADAAGKEDGPKKFNVKKALLIFIGVAAAFVALCGAGLAIHHFAPDIKAAVAKIKGSRHKDKAKPADAQTASAVAKQTQPVQSVSAASVTTPPKTELKPLDPKAVSAELSMEQFIPPKKINLSELPMD
jgi:cytoskeletal protein RodZ